jgi:hypothetical protein
MRLFDNSFVKFSDIGRNLTIYLLSALVVGWAVHELLVRAQAVLNAAVAGVTK